MNILHLKYAVEVAATGSINKAAENLYMGQPNLSRAIKELEESLGITIFHRTPKGIHITDEGKEFLHYARRILAQVEQVERLYDESHKQALNFSLCAPDDSYIFRAVSELSAGLDINKPLKLYCVHGDFVSTVNGVIHSNYNLGIVRYNVRSDRTAKAMLKEKGLELEEIRESEHRVIMHKSHPLAELPRITLADLECFTEIISPSFASGSLFEERENSKRQIYVSDRAARTELLSKVKDTFMWAEPDEYLQKNSEFAEKVCINHERNYKDVLIYRRDYKLTQTDKDFVRELKKQKNEII